jgi:hypothetical protein
MQRLRMLIDSFQVPRSGKPKSTRAGRIEISAAETPEKVLETRLSGIAFIYISSRVGDGKCARLLLFERINSGYYANNKGCNSVGGANVVESNKKRMAVISVPRAWTCLTNRRNGVTTTLLDTACETVAYRITLGKDVVAFSQPTERGEPLARWWFFFGCRDTVTIRDIAMAECADDEIAPSPSRSLPPVSPQNIQAEDLTEHNRAPVSGWYTSQP